VNVPLPLPLPFALLVLALPGVWLAGRAAAYAITTDRALRVVLPSGLALAGWLLAVHACSLASGSLRVGLPLGTLGLAAAGLVAERARARRELAHDDATGERPSAWMWIGMAVTAALVSRAAFGFSFHDELLPVGHMSMAAEIQGASYPPRYLFFPTLPLRYHYAFDLLSASTSALLRISIPVAIDVATIGLWCASFTLLWVLGMRLGARHPWATPLVALLAGGLPVACEDPGGLVYAVLVVCRVGGTFSLNAPVVSYFFQHPWAVGIPLAITTILILDDRPPEPEPRVRFARLAALAALLATLAFGEIVLFVGLLPCVVVAMAWPEGRFDRKGALSGLAVGAVALAGARLEGGFLAQTHGLPALGFTLHAGYAERAIDTLTWNLRTFGALLPLGALGLVVAARGRLVFGLLAAGSLVTVNAIRYAGSHDILKFATLASIALGVLAAQGVSRLLDPDGPARRAHAVAGAALLALAVGEGAAFVGCFVLDLQSIPAALRRGPAELAPDDVAAMAFVRARVQPGELVYRRQPVSLAYAQWGGLPQPWVDWTAGAFGVSAQMIAERQQLLGVRPPAPTAWAAQGFGWFVLDDTPADAALRRLTDAWIAAGRATLAGTFGALRVVELPPG
jgi:hypothetical protein